MRQAAMRWESYFANCLPLQCIILLDKSVKNNAYTAGKDFFLCSSKRYGALFMDVLDQLATTNSMSAPCVDASS